jgi:pyrroline-5-carboxylate reductase
VDKKMKLTIIGNGNMALALIAGLYKKYELEVVGRDMNKLKAISDTYENVQISQITNNFDINGKNIILCVKPYSLQAVKKNLNGVANTLFSILAGTTIATLKSAIASQSYVRVMPNISAIYGSSMTTLTGDLNAKDLSIDIFDSVGSTLWLDSENELDIATAIAGSGPAYLALIAESMADGGVKAGLKRADSKAIVAGLFGGFGDLIKHIEPSNIKEQVMSPSGTTACGVASLEEANIRSAFIKAVESAYHRALELGKK